MARSFQPISVIQESIDAASPTIPQAPINHQQNAPNLDQIIDLSKPSHFLNGQASPPKTLFDQSMVSGPPLLTPNVPKSSPPRLHWKKGMLPAKHHPLSSYSDTISSLPEARKVSRCSLERPKKAQVPLRRDLSVSHPHHPHLHHRQLYCEPCDRSFPSAVYHKIHLRYFHSADKSFICRICNSKTKLLSSFKYHLASLHKKTWRQYLQMVEFVLVDDPESDWQSPDVNLPSSTPFSSPNRPKSPPGTDESSRDGSKSGSQFPSSSSVYKPKCSTCDRLFVSKYTLEEHVQVQHRGQRFVCLICSQQLKYKSTLATHVKQVHGMPMRKYSQLANY